MYFHQNQFWRFSFLVVNYNISKKLSKQFIGQIVQALWQLLFFSTNTLTTFYLHGTLTLVFLCGLPQIPELFQIQPFSSKCGGLWNNNQHTWIKRSGGTDFSVLHTLRPWYIKIVYHEKWFTAYWRTLTAKVVIWDKAFEMVVRIVDWDTIIRGAGPCNYSIGDDGVLAWG